MKYLYILILLLSICISPAHDATIKHLTEPKVIDSVQLKRAMDFYTDFYRIPRGLMYSIAEQESRWKLVRFMTDTSYKMHEQIGQAGELGAFQIKLRTARMVWNDWKTPDKVLRRKLLYNVKFNTETACKLLVADYDFYANRFSKLKKADLIWKMATTAYNMGRYKTNNIKKPSKYALSVYARWKRLENM